MQHFFRIFATCLIAIASNLWAGTVTVTPAKDNTTVLRNPTMGFVGYCGLWDNAPAIDLGGDWDKYCNIIYLRAQWSSLEPSEGQFVWETQAFKDFIVKMRAKGYRFGFRAIAQDHGTPDWVIQAIRNAGQEPFSKQSFDGAPLPDLRNKIWQAKFQAFVEAFGKTFDDPTITDYIDINGLGPSGEGNPWVEGFDDPPTEHPVYFDWHVSLFDKAFKHVILVDNLGFDFDRPIDEKYKLQWRADGFAGPDSTIWKLFDTLAYPEHFLITEPYGGGSVTNYLSDALVVHANAVHTGYFLNYWTTQPQQLARAIANLGYRLRPETVQYPSSVASNSPFLVKHTWVNDGVGALPNNDIRWNGKYAVAFALFSGNNNSPTQVAIQPWTNPGEFLKGKPTQISSWVNWVAPPGNYKLAVGILDKTRASDSSLALAIADPVKRSGWYLIGDIQITDENPTRSAFERIEAESCNSFANVCIAAGADVSQAIGCIATGGYAVYRNIDFGSGTHSFSARIGSASGAGAIAIHLDNLNTPAVATLTNTTNTGDWETFATTSVDVPEITGIHDVYLQFDAGFNFDWFTFSAKSAFRQIEAESYSSKSGMCVNACAEGGQDFQCIGTGDWAMYKAIDFGAGAHFFNARIGSSLGTGKIAIHLDSLNAPTAATLTNTTNTGDWEVFTTVSTDIPVITGIHDVYLQFDAGFGFNWFTFAAQSAFSQIEAESYTSKSGMCVNACAEGGQDFQCIGTGNWAMYKAIDFGAGARSFNARIGSSLGTGKIAIHLDSLNAPTAASLTNTTNTGDWEVFTTVSTEIPVITGIHDVYLQFDAGFGFNWFTFGKNSVGVHEKPVATKFEALLHNNRLRISLPWNGTTKIRLVSITGQSIFSSTISGTNADLAIGDIPRGVYLLETRSDKGLQIQRLIKN